MSGTARVPRTFHFVFGLRPQTEPFHVLHWLCLASCLAVNRPQRIRFHYRHEPHGEWWQRIKPRLDLARVPDHVEGFAPERYAHSAEGRLIERLGLAYAHEADFLRMDILLREGGVYADMDTLFVKAYPDAWFDADFVIGEENAAFARGEILQPSLCNAVMLARPGAAFGAAWRARMAQAFDGSWSRHSCREAARVWRDAPQAVRVLPTPYFYRYHASVPGLELLLEDADVTHDDLYSVHLWAHLWWDAARTDFSRVHAGEITLDWLRTRDCTLARLARLHLDEALRA